MLVVPADIPAVGQRRPELVRVGRLGLAGLCRFFALPGCRDQLLGRIGPIFRGGRGNRGSRPGVMRSDQLALDLGRDRPAALEQPELRPDRQVGQPGEAVAPGGVAVYLLNVLVALGEAPEQRGLGDARFIGGLEDGAEGAVGAVEIRFFSVGLLLGGQRLVPEVEDGGVGDGQAYALFRAAGALWRLGGIFPRRRGRGLCSAILGGFLRAASRLACGLGPGRSPFAVGKGVILFRSRKASTFEIEAQSCAVANGPR